VRTRLRSRTADALVTAALLASHARAQRATSLIRTPGAKIARARAAFYQSAITGRSRGRLPSGSLSTCSGALRWPCGPLPRQEPISTVRADLGLPLAGEFAGGEADESSATERAAASRVRNGAGIPASSPSAARAPRFLRAPVLAGGITTRTASRALGHPSQPQAFSVLEALLRGWTRRHSCWTRSPESGSIAAAALRSDAARLPGGRADWGRAVQRTTCCRHPS